MATPPPPRSFKKGPQPPSLKRSLPQEEPQQVEVTKVDPEAVARGTVSLEDDQQFIEEIDLKKAPKYPFGKEGGSMSSLASEDPDNPVPPGYVPFPPSSVPEKKKRRYPRPSITNVNSNVVKFVAERFGLRPEETFSAIVKPEGAEDSVATLSIKYRKPQYDDVLWATSFAQDAMIDVDNEEDDLLPDQRSAIQYTFYTHYMATRCLVAMEGISVWEAFGLVDEVKAALPDWDGQSWGPISTKLKNKLNLIVFEFFHYHTVVGLATALVREILLGPNSAKEDEDSLEEDKEEDDPSLDPTSAT